MRAVFVLLMLITFVGCSNSAAEVVTIDKVPEAMLKAAQKELPEVQFDNAIKHSDGSYEVRGKDHKGKVRDVEFSPSRAGSALGRITTSQTGCGQMTESQLSEV